MASWITFDCFGTLVDWHAGFTSILAPVALERTPALLHAYHRFEGLVEAEKPHQRYKDVLATSLRRAADETGAPLSDTQVQTLADSWDRLPVFGDVEPMLASLREAGYQLGILTNCDDDLFAKTQRAFATPFEMVITAEQVRDYKPSLTHFRRFEHRASPDDWIHVACSWHHDIAPARRFGIKCIWLDRDKTGEDAAAASARIESAGELLSTIRAIAGVP